MLLCSCFIYADKMRVKRREHGICFVPLCRIICILFVASQREESIGSHRAWLPTGTAKHPGFPGSLDCHRGRKCWWEAEVEIRRPGGFGHI